MHFIIKISEQNKYVNDFLRVAIVVNDEFTAYKYYDKDENIYHKENEPDTLINFDSQYEIFDDFSIDFMAGETKKIIVFVWIEKLEFYNDNGEHYKGLANKSYTASTIMLSMEIK